MAKRRAKRGCGCPKRSRKVGKRCIAKGGRVVPHKKGCRR